MAKAPKNIKGPKTLKSEKINDKDDKMGKEMGKKPMGKPVGKPMITIAIGIPKKGKPKK